MKKTIAMLTVPLAALTLSACMSSPTSLPPGHYEHTSTSVDAQGTSRTKDSSTDVYYDQYGNKKAKVDSKTTTDPKGLFNKSTSETHEQVE